MTNDMRHKIQRIDHAKLTQGLLGLCCMIPGFIYYCPCDSKDHCEMLLRDIERIAKETTFLRRNSRVPLLCAYNIVKNDDGILFESLAGKPYLEFKIVETE